MICCCCQWLFCMSLQGDANVDANVPAGFVLGSDNGVHSAHTPYVFVADDAFPLSNNIMKPYASRNLTHEQRVFNYRLSRARRTVENAFGILANKFRVFLTPITLEPSKVEKVVLASCALHNFLRSKSASRALYTPTGYMDTELDKTHEVIRGVWRSESEGLQPIQRQGTNTYSASSKDIRDELCAYFNSSAGEVPWQNNFA
jgi:hypothetical protein